MQRVVCNNMCRSVFWHTNIAIWSCNIQYCACNLSVMYLTLSLICPIGTCKISKRSVFVPAPIPNFELNYIDMMTFLRSMWHIVGSSHEHVHVFCMHKCVMCQVLANTFVDFSLVFQLLFHTCPYCNVHLFRVNQLCYDQTWDTMHAHGTLVKQRVSWQSWFRTHARSLTCWLASSRCIISFCW